MTEEDPVITHSGDAPINDAPKKRRGRPPKKAVDHSSEEPTAPVQPVEPVQLVQLGKRERKSREVFHPETFTTPGKRKPSSTTGNNTTGTGTGTGKRRGRPPKNAPPNTSNTTSNTYYAHKPGVSRNLAEMSGGEANKWDNYRALVARALAVLTREWHYLELLTGCKALSVEDITTKFTAYLSPSPSAENDGNDGNSRRKSNKASSELSKCVQKIHSTKQSIVSLLDSLAQEHSTHKRWPQLSEADDAGMVDLEDVLCSLCLTEETEENDILLCDHAGCNRAYHQRCLSPQLSLEAMQRETEREGESDWFCWQCECIDDCLDLIGERCGRDYNSPSEVFSELKLVSSSSSASAADNAGVGGGAGTIMDAVFGEDEEEDDDEFAPDESDDEDLAEEENDNSEEGENSHSSDIDNEEEERSGDEADEEDEDHEDDEDDENDVMDEEGDILEDAQGEGEEGDDLADVEADELAALLQDAQAEESEYLFDQQASTEGQYRRKLRDRSKTRTQPSLSLSGESDVGREVSRVVRGVFVSGKVSAFRLSERGAEGEREGEQEADSERVEEDKRELATTIENVTSSKPVSLSDTHAQSLSPSQPSLTTEEDLNARGVWTVTFDDGLEREMSASELRAALALYEEYQQRLRERESRQSGLRSQIQSLVESKGALKSENVLAHKRQRQSIDYVALSMEIFGTVKDEDEQLDDEYNAMRDRRSVRSRRKRSARKSEADDEEGDDGEADIEEEFEEPHKRKRRKRTSSAAKTTRTKTNADGGEGGEERDESAVPVVRKRGRPKGSKSKPREEGKEEKGEKREKAKESEKEPTEEEADDSPNNGLAGPVGEENGRQEENNMETIV